MAKRLLEIAADIVQTRAGVKSMTSAEIATSLRMVFPTLREMQKSEAEGTALAMPEIAEGPQVPESAPKVQVSQDSIQENKVIFLECGAEMRQLTAKHLVSHGLDQKQYMKKYGFTMRTPLAAKKPFLLLAYRYL